MSSSSSSSSPGHFAPQAITVSPVPDRAPVRGACILAISLPAAHEVSRTCLTLISQHARWPSMSHPAQGVTQ